MTTFYTGREIAGVDDKSFPEMRMLWKPTCLIAGRPPFRGFSGRFSNTIVMVHRRGKVRVGANAAPGYERFIMRRYVIPRDPKSAAQLRKRANMRLATAAWSAISEKQRVEWKSWTDRYRRSPDAEKVPSAQNVFVGAAMTVSMMGVALPTSAPSGAPPPVVVSITQAGAPGDDCFAFRVRHGLKSVSGLRLLFELTDAMPTLKRKPQEPQLCLFSADDASSFVPLKADGELYVLENARFAVAPGQRYGVRVTIVTGHGIRGPGRCADFIKPGSGATAAVQRGASAQPAAAGARTAQSVKTKPTGAKSPQRVQGGDWGGAW